jgi:hypothetical protein
MERGRQSARRGAPAHGDGRPRADEATICNPEQPDELIDDAEGAEFEELLGKSGEPRRNEPSTRRFRVVSSVQNDANF